MNGEREDDAAAQEPGKEDAAERLRLRARYLDLWEATLSGWAEAAPEASRARRD